MVRTSSRSRSFSALAPIPGSAVTGRSSDDAGGLRVGASAGTDEWSHRGTRPAPLSLTYARAHQNVLALGRAGDRTVRSGRALALVVTGLAVLAVTVALVDLGRLFASPTPSPTPGEIPQTLTPSPTVAASPSPATPSPAAPGTITGGLAYPSEFIPPLTVYAISVAEPRTFFSVDTPRYPLSSGPTPAQPTYEITGVAPGTYYVLAYRNDQAPLAEERPGVYSQYVLCGGRTSCTDHSLVPVTVRAGETVRGIDVSDWYYPPDQRYPPRPR